MSTTPFPHVEADAARIDREAAAVVAHATARTPPAVVYARCDRHPPRPAPPPVRLRSHTSLRPAPPLAPSASPAHESPSRRVGADTPRPHPAPPREQELFLAGLAEEAVRVAHASGTTDTLPYSALGAPAAATRRPTHAARPTAPRACASAGCAECRQPQQLSCAGWSGPPPAA